MIWLFDKRGRRNVAVDVVIAVGKELKAFCASEAVSGSKHGIVE